MIYDYIYTYTACMAQLPKTSDTQAIYQRFCEAKI